MNGFYDELRYIGSAQRSFGRGGKTHLVTTSSRLVELSLEAQSEKAQISPPKDRKRANRLSFPRRTWKSKVVFKHRYDWQDSDVSLFFIVVIIHSSINGGKCSEAIVSSTTNQDRD